MIYFNYGSVEFPESVEFHNKQLPGITPRNIIFPHDRLAPHGILRRHHVGDAMDTVYHPSVPVRGREVSELDTQRSSMGHRRCAWPRKADPANSVNVCDAAGRPGAFGKRKKRIDLRGATELLLRTQRNMHKTPNPAASPARAADPRAISRVEAGG